MKQKLLILLFVVIGTLIGCKKSDETAKSTYSDKELNINSKSMFAIEERKIKQGIMEFKHLNLEDRMRLVKNIGMDNKNIAFIDGNSMNILNKLNQKNTIELFKILIPNSSFKIENNGKIIGTYNQNHTEWSMCDFWIGHYNKREVSYYADKCKTWGENLCMQYVPCP